ELHRLLDWKVGWLGPFENLIDINGSAPIQVGSVRSICHQTAKFDEFLQMRSTADGSLRQGQRSVFGFQQTTCMSVLQAHQLAPWSPLEAPCRDHSGAVLRWIEVVDLTLVPGADFLSKQVSRFDYLQDPIAEPLA